MKINKWSLGFAFALTGLTAYLLLDTFVIPEVYEKDVSQAEEHSLAENTASSFEHVPDSNEYATDTGEYAADTDNEKSKAKASDEPVIQVETYRVNNTNIYVADILFSSVEYVKTAFAQDTYGRKVTATTSDTAMENNALLAINGDFYGARECGYVIRNGILYRDTPSDEDVLCIYKDGRMEIIDPNKVTAQELIENGAWQAFSFGPGLLEDGEILVDTRDEVGLAMASNPRTAIGMIDTNHYVFVVSDGRTSDNEGLSLYELAGFMKELGVTTAYNLDGGGSSTMVYEGEIINIPTSGRYTNERSVSDIVYIG